MTRRTNQFAIWIRTVNVRKGIVAVGKRDIGNYWRVERCQRNHVRRHPPFHGKSPRLAGLQRIGNIRRDREGRRQRRGGNTLGCLSGFENS